MHGNSQFLQLFKLEKEINLYKTLKQREKDALQATGLVYGIIFNSEMQCVGNLKDHPALHYKNSYLDFLSIPLS